MFLKGEPLDRIMKLPDNTIWHLVHSSNALKINRMLFIFDYPLGMNDLKPGDGLHSGFVNPCELTEENVYIFVSHGHDDHFNPDIFYWRNHIRQITYILSSDITGYPANSVITSPGQYLKLENFAVQTYPSTDCGVAFSIYVNGLHIYFAGDNGFWNWDGSLEDDVYINSALRMINRSKPVDIAFQLCDPRLAEMGAGGVYAFARYLNPACIIPIHLFGNYDFCETVDSNLKDLGYSGKFWKINGRGDTFDISIHGSKV
ncbi:MAG: hypothetical protein A2161_20780 [Candidatus Schekmanbacteria bacterium RBG_13_48_7]|uniref:Metallo-beta-lactamase domain-containing protein n=1 Tax=Candidatus Schekmanbacteria bacterium RBG_13_48_7 TaxID=1817878 RepID=A0A1F7S463_9BACT|nr:MAG: hypothetical protein A2161_20780 [Candidatus Schekmanbacteria bacterium RBG_13_48_7]